MTELEDSRQYKTRVLDYPWQYHQSYSPSSFQDSGGTGMGLFVSKNIVESQGGKIEAQNNADGKGALFSFIIPK
jgi:signal transduction histidine kinase